MGPGSRIPLWDPTVFFIILGPGSQIGVFGGPGIRDPAHFNPCVSAGAVAQVAAARNTTIYYSIYKIHIFYPEFVGSTGTPLLGGKSVLAEVYICFANSH